MKFGEYAIEGFFDEIFGENGAPRASAKTLVHNIECLPPGELLNRQQGAERALLQMGITFNVYGELMPRTRGFRSIVRVSAGSISIPPTIKPPARTISP